MVAGLCAALAAAGQGVLRELHRWQKDRAEFLQLQASFQAEDEQAQGQPPPR